MEPILSGENTLVVIPTASGKSLIAYIAIMKRLLLDNPGSRAIYIVPLKALAREKYSELQQIAKSAGLRVGLGMGDGEGTNDLESSDIMVCTSEKLDSIMKLRPELISRVSIVVSDETHLLNDRDRGPTLEINLTRLRILRPDAQIIALSATVGNSEEISSWLDAKLIQSEWRPVKLEYSTLSDLFLEPRLVQIAKGETEDLNVPRVLSGPSSHICAAVLDDTIEQSGQLLIFVNSRRSAQSEARRLAKRNLKKLGDEEKEELGELAKKISSLNDSITGEALAEAVKGGVAFHHAGLTNRQRVLIEDAFKSRMLTAIAATPTLASGVNLPARRVLVRDMKRFDGGMSRPLAVMEVRQMLGRAGRPGFDDQGEAWIACKGDSLGLADDMAERYFFGPVEDVRSNLAADPPLRVHLLSAIANSGIQSRAAVRRFFSATFLGFTTPESWLHDRIDAMLRWLLEERLIRRTGMDSNETEEASDDWDDETPAWVLAAKEVDGIGQRKQIEPILGFRKASHLESVSTPIEKNDPLATTYEATEMGHTISRLGLDPLSGVQLRDGLRRAVRRRVRESAPVDEFSMLHLVASTPDFIEVHARSKDLEMMSPLRSKAGVVEDFLLVEAEYEERHLSLVKTAWCISDWINEETHRSIEKNHSVTPGDLNLRVDLMGWLLRSGRSILITDDVFSEQHSDVISELVKEIDNLGKRVRHGCKEELLRLVSLRNIGRSRARQLVQFGVRTPEKLLELSSKDLDKLMSKRGWGPKLLERLLNDVRAMINPKKSMKSRSDDEPLPGERTE